MTTPLDKITAALEATSPAGESRYFIPIAREYLVALVAVAEALDARGDRDKNGYCHICGTEPDEPHTGNCPFTALATLVKEVPDDRV